MPTMKMTAFCDIAPWSLTVEVNHVSEVCTASIISVPC
jgi:hypothetical protein